MTYISDFASLDVHGGASVLNHKHHFISLYYSLFCQKAFTYIYIYKMQLSFIRLKTELEVCFTNSKPWIFGITESRKTQVQVYEFPKDNGNVSVKLLLQQHLVP